MEQTEHSMLAEHLDIRKSVLAAILDKTSVVWFFKEAVTVRTTAESRNYLALDNTN